MDWEILETKEKTTFRNQINALYEEINQFETEIIGEIHPQLVSQEAFCTSENWWYVREEGLHAYDADGSLFFANANEKANYTSFKETNVAFSRLPKQPLEVLPGEMLIIQSEAEISQGITIKLAVAEYSAARKIKTSFVEMNKEHQLTLDKETTALRFAFKIVGAGLAKIKHLQVNRFFQAKRDTSIPANDDIPNDWHSLKQIKDLRIACILDEFTMTSFDKVVDLITFTPNNWQEVLTEAKPHLLFVESAWHGNGDTWQYKVGKYSNDERKELKALLAWCQERDIPTVFWNKEDPIHYEKFIDSAKRFDYIYTTDANKIPDYQKQAKHERVFALPFAAEPSQHNPIQLGIPKEDKVCFAGSYYANRHIERREKMDEMLAISADYGLVIYDRNFERTEEEFLFPKRFRENVIGSLAYKDIAKAYKGYRYILNVNSVIDSPTMFSRRVFEGLASGTPILSSYSKGIEEIFGNIVMIAQNPRELQKQLAAMRTNETAYREKTLLGIREVYEKHTYQKRMAFILKNMGVTIADEEPSVAVIAKVDSTKDVEAVIEQFERQTYLTKKLILLVDDLTEIQTMINRYSSEQVEICILDYTKHYTKLRTFTESSYLAYFDSANYYGENYLKDLMIATKYTQADFIGKASYYEVTENKLACKQAEAEYRFVTGLWPDRSIMSTSFPFEGTVYDSLKAWINKEDLSAYFAKGAQLFSADKFNFIENGQTLAEADKANIGL